MSFDLYPTEINLHQKSRLLEIVFSDGKQYQLPCEFLRVNARSAEVKNSDVPVHGKINVNIEKIEPQGDYGIRIYFDDGYNTGIFSWETLYDMGEHQQQYWEAYLERLQVHHLTRGESDKKTSGRIKVLYFMDKIIKFTQKDEEIIELDDRIKTVQDLLAFLRQRGLIWKREFADDAMLFTVNKEFAELFTVLEDGDEVAFVPRSK